MSLDYHFRLTTQRPPQEVLRLALETLGLRPRSTLTREGVFEETVGPGFLVSAGPVAPMSRALLEEAWGISPTVDIHFWLDAGDERHAALTAMLQSIVAVLRQDAGDAVLLFSGETPLLLRHEGKLLLDARSGIWTRERLSLVDLPYALRNLPTL